MDKKPLIGVSIVAVVLLILASLTNVIGFQAVQSSAQKAINSEVDQKELLFQTIVDIANNKEIQQVILKSQGLFNPDVKFPIFKTPVVTKNYLKQMYLVGLMFSKTISKSRMRLMVERYKVSNQWIQKEVTAIIEKDATIKAEITQLSNLNCNCENNSGVTVWYFTVICKILPILYTLDVIILWHFFGWGVYLGKALEALYVILNC